MSNVEHNPGPQAINASFENKAALIHEVMSDHRLDVVAVTETWMLSDDPDAVKHDIAPVRYHLLNACRGLSADTHRGGGGVAIIHRDSFKL